MVEHSKYKCLIILAGIFTILGFSDLVFSVYNTKRTDHLTFSWIFLILLSQILLITYGLLNNVYGIYLPALIICTGLLYILYVKLSNEVNNEVEAELKTKNII